MSRHDPRVRLHHMVDYGRQAVELMAGRSRAEFAASYTLILAEARLVEIVGEAASHVPAAIRDELPQVPWRAVIGMRNRLIHGYDMASIDIIHDTVINDLPVVITVLTDYLDSQA